MARKDVEGRRAYQRQWQAKNHERLIKYWRDYAAAIQKRAE